MSESVYMWERVKENGEIAFVEQFFLHSCQMLSAAYRKGLNKVVSMTTVNQPNKAKFGYS